MTASGLPQMVGAAWLSVFGRGVRMDPEMVRQVLSL